MQKFAKTQQEGNDNLNNINIVIIIAAVAVLLIISFLIIRSKITARKNKKKGNNYSENFFLSLDTDYPLTAVVCCKGTKNNTDTKMIYSGVNSCAMANQLFGGDKNCRYACMGLGDCARKCPQNAILLCDGVAVVNPSLCTACSICKNVCPKGVIEMIPKGQLTATVMCKNHNNAVQTQKDCIAGCIACEKCVNICPNGAITMDNFVATVNNSLCTACGNCIQVCSAKAIELLRL